MSSRMLQNVNHLNVGRRTAGTMPGWELLQTLVHNTSTTAAYAAEDQKIIAFGLFRETHQRQGVLSTYRALVHQKTSTTTALPTNQTPGG